MNALHDQIHVVMQTLFQRNPALCGFSVQEDLSFTHVACHPALGGEHVGFILNRATGVKLATLFPEHAPSAKVVDPVYFGGPEMVDSIFAIVRRDPGTPSLRLFGDLFVTASADAVDRIIEKTPND